MHPHRLTRASMLLALFLLIPLALPPPRVHAMGHVPEGLPCELSATGPPAMMAAPLTPTATAIPVPTATAIPVPTRCPVLPCLGPLLTPIPGLVIPCSAPRLVLVPLAGTGVLVLHGSGFVPLSPLLITIDGQLLVATTPGGALCTTDALGSIQCVLCLSSLVLLGPGPHLMTATDTGGRMAVTMLPL